MFTFELVSIEGIKFSQEVYEVVLPTKDGYIGVFPHHMPLISLVVPGVITVRKNKDTPEYALEKFAVNQGVVEIDENLVRILVDDADHSDEIVLKDAEAAHQRAEELCNSAKDQISLEKAEAELNLTQARLQVAKLKKRRR